MWVPSAATPAATGEVRRTLGRDVEPMLVGQTQFDAALQAAYTERKSAAASIVDEVQGEAELSRLMQDLPEVEDLLEARHDAPIIRMLNALLSQAVSEGASDVHVEAFEASSVVRYRLDGVLRDIVRPRRALHAALVSRIKIMANLDIAPKPPPHDGRILLRLGRPPIAVRRS